MPAYRLQTLLQIRERAEEDAKQAFSEAMRALTKEKQTLKNLQDDLERRKQARKAKVQAYLQEILEQVVFAFLKKEEVLLLVE